MKLSDMRNDDLAVESARLVFAILDILASHLEKCELPTPAGQIVITPDSPNTPGYRTYRIVIDCGQGGTGDCAVTVGKKLH